MLERSSLDEFGVIVEDVVFVCRLKYLPPISCPLSQHLTPLYSTWSSSESLRRKLRYAQLYLVEDGFFEEPGELFARGGVDDED